jgi:glucan phosphorylase
MDQIRELAAFAEDDDFQEEFIQVKRKNKERLR